MKISVSEGLEGTVGGAGVYSITWTDVALVTFVSAQPMRRVDDTVMLKHSRHNTTSVCIWDCAWSRGRL